LSYTFLAFSSALVSNFVFSFKEI